MKSKNYILLFVIYILTILCVLYFCKIYHNSSSLKGVSIDDYVLDVTGNSYDELYNNILNFSKENDNFIIYISSYKQDSSSFEDVFIDVITEKGLKNKILFINSDSLSNYDYVNKLIDSLDGIVPISKKYLPVFVSVKNQKVINIDYIRKIDEESLKNILGGVYD